MIKTIEHGENPFEVIVLHGGPCAPGSAKGLAKVISKYKNTIELYNAGDTIEKQINEILETVDKYDIKNPILIGHSWGAWLSCLAAAEHDIFGGIILIGCGPFEDKYLNKMSSTRNNKLNLTEQKLLSEIFEAISKDNLSNVDMHTFGYLMAKMDGYELDLYDEKMDSFDVKTHNKLMDEIRNLRTSKELLEKASRISCSINVIHGLDDPHPYEGVVEPFDFNQINFEYDLIEKCGHTPWQEKFAKEEFEKIISKILS